MAYQNDLGGREQHPQIAPQRRSRDRTEVVAHLLDLARKIVRVALSDLRPPGEAGPDQGTEGVVRDGASEQFVVRDRVRTGTDEVHVPAQDVPELGQLIEVELSKPPAEWSDAIFVVPLPFRGGGLLAAHGAELQQPERPTVQPHTLLDEQHGTSVGHVDGQSDERHHRESRQQRHGGHDGAHAPLHRTVETVAQTRMRDQQMQRSSLIEEDLAGQPLIGFVPGLHRNAPDLLREELAHG